MQVYKCGYREDSSVYAHGHSSEREWRDCVNPRYTGTDRDKAVPTPGRSTKLYTDAPSEFDITEKVEKTVTTRRSLESNETPEEKAERKAAEAAEIERTKKAEREKYKRDLQSQRSPLAQEIRGLTEDAKVARNGWVPIGFAGIVSLGLLGGAAVLSAVPGSLFTALIVIGFILGGIGFAGTVGGGIYWFERFYGGRPPRSEIAIKQARVDELDNEIARYTDIPNPSDWAANL